MDERKKKTVDAYDKYAKEFSDFYSSLKGNLPFFKVFVEHLKHGRVLDAGCGHGKHCRLFEENNFEVVGLDLSSKLLEIAGENSPNTLFVQGDMCRIPFENDLFDGIWAYASLHHIPRDLHNQVLTEFNRVLTPTGYLFISVKEGKGERYKGTSVFNDEERFFCYFEKDYLTDLIESHDFNIIDLARHHWLEHEKWFKVLAGKK